MRKIMACALLFLLLLAAGAPAAAEGVQPELVEFICETYALSEDEFVVVESYEISLAHLDINLTMHTWVTDSLKGQVAWNHKEQKYIDDDELAQLFVQEKDLASQEYQQLQEQAGKMDVWLYQQVQTGKDDAVYDIYIFPFFDLTPGLEKQIRDLYSQYGLEAPPELDTGFPGYTGTVDSGQSEPGSPGAAEPGFPGEDSTPASPPATGTDSAEPFPADAAPVPQPIIDTGETGIAQGDDPVSSIDERPMIPEEFYSALSQLYAQGFAQSLASLSAHLDSIGVQYREEMNVVSAAATAPQILDLRHRSDVLWITSAVIVEDLAQDSPLPEQENADGREPVSYSGEANGQVKALNAPGNNLSWVYAGGALGLAALGLGIFFTNRRKH